MPSKVSAVLVYAAIVAGCLGPDRASENEVYRPPAGPNPVLREPVSLGDGLEVIVTDVVIPPNAEIPAHFHPSEEIVYVIEGSAVHRENGKPQRKLVAGDSIVIAPGAHHAPRGGPNGARAIVFRLHKSGSVEAIPVDEPAAAE